MAALQRDRRRGEQALVELRRRFHDLRARHEPVDQLLQQAGAGQQQRRAEDVEAGVRDGDAIHRGGLVQNRRRKERAHRAEQDQADDCADHVEGKVDQCGALRIFIRADGGEQRRDARADVLAHDDGDGRAIADGSRDGQRLQNADGSRAGLDDAGQHRAGQHAEDGICKCKEQLRELRHILQPGDRAGHRLHAEHQRGEAQQDHAGVFFLAALAEHVQNNADQGQNWRERRRLQQLHPHGVALDSAEAEQPCRDRRADVGAHDDVDRLPQRQQPGIDKADDHDRRGRGTLNHSRDPETRGKTGQFPAGHLPQQ